ncbi:MAG: GNAT family N-acetyltransferase [Marmoricola sp.]
MSPEEVQLRPAVPEDLGAIADLFLASRAAAVPLLPPVADPEDARAWVSGWDLTEREVWVAWDDAGPRGFASVEKDWLSGLYVDPTRQRTGIGSALLDVVKSLRPDGFALWVFESNWPAHAFYLAHGLVRLEHTDGSDNMERSPDLRMAWPGSDPVAYFRSEIDEVDGLLAVLLARRAALTAAVQPHKPVAGHAGRDTEREAEIAVRMSAHAPGLDAEALTRIMHAVIAESLDAWESGDNA